ncbi:VIR protein [Plasmodium vivax]|uniref:VIR protein n=1 Tax=Plasmodium vivax TaxID=5855 RepID=A0A1G4H0I5_PLAVI|nr:VIR protein [Plasmodium vivax]
MSSTSGSKCNTLNKGLPSSTFDDKFSESIDLSTLESAALLNEPIDLEEWIKTFTQTFPIKYKEIFNTEDKNIHDKRCRDLNYHLDYIADLILQLASKREHGKKFKIYENYLKTMKQVMESLFDPSSNYSCRRYYKRYVFQMPIRKDLDDFCENRDYLLSSIAKDPGNCDKLISYVNEKYNCSFNDKTCITDAGIPDTKFFHISANCTLYDIPKTFSYGHCSHYKMPHRIKSIPHCPAAQTSTFGNFLQYISDYMQYIPGISFIQDNLLYVGIGVGGVLTLFFIIYKFSPLGYFYRRRKKKNQEISDMMHGYTAPLGNNLFYGMPPPMQNVPYRMPTPMQNVPYRMPTPMQNMQYRMPLPMQNMPYRMLPPTQNMQYRMAYQAE